MPRSQQTPGCRTSTTPSPSASSGATRHRRRTHPVHRCDGGRWRHRPVQRACQLGLVVRSDFRTRRLPFRLLGHAPETIQHHRRWRDRELPQPLNTRSSRRRHVRQRPGDPHLRQRPQAPGDPHLRQRPQPPGCIDKRHHAPERRPLPALGPPAPQITDGQHGERHQWRAMANRGAKGSRVTGSHGSPSRMTSTRRNRGRQLWVSASYGEHPAQPRGPAGSHSSRRSVDLDSELRAQGYSRGRNRW